MEISGHFKDYLLKSSLAPTSMSIKGRAVRYLIELLGDVDPAVLTYSDAEDYVNWLKKGRGPSAVNSYLRCIKSFFNWLVRRDKIRESPFAFIKFLPENNRFKPTYSGDELVRLMMISNARWKVVILLALCGGLRRAEILNLTVRDIFWDTNSILIEPKEDTISTWAWTIKNHQQAFVPFPEVVKLPGMEINFHKLVLDLIDTLPDSQPYFILSPLQYGRQIASLRVGTMNYLHRLQPWQSFSRDFSRLMHRAQINAKSLRDLRATFGTTLAENNVSLTKTQNLMRHRSPITTARFYVRHDKQKLIDESVKISGEYYVSSSPKP